ncbi:MAG: hypothetical protein FWC41_09990 [Firmicutes bacterium]|nr:hypothetical protein [Bacillota bacterium]
MKILIRRFKSNTKIMRTISLQMSEQEFNLLGLTKEKEQISLSELKDFIEIQKVKEAVSECVRLAKEAGLDKMTLDEINEEIRAVRNQCKK